MYIQIGLLEPLNKCVTSVYIYYIYMCKYNCQSHGPSKRHVPRVLNQITTVTVILLTFIESSDVFSIKPSSPYMCSMALFYPVS